jgi:3-deoxy-manno-octulosonate cytidylyltransferase (CMP-KDO synthetase)
VTPLAARIAALELLVCDVDGVLTDGSLHYGPDGEGDHKAFHVRDGLGLRRLLEAGVKIAWITARGGPAVERRARELGVEHLVQGSKDKAAALAELATRLGIATPAIAYVGDDLVDRDAMRAAGLAIAPADAHAEIRALAHWVTTINGGRGAVREICDAILAARSTSPDIEFRILIPARMAATRLPGKPLRMLAGKPLVAHVHDRATEAGAAEIVVATDDTRIDEVIRGIGGTAMMTRPDHPSGSDRIHEVVTRLDWPDDTIVVNLQGDEPGMPASAIKQVAQLLATTPGAHLATLATPIREAKDLFDPSVVKVVIDDRNLARTFSRAPIPWVRGVFEPGQIATALPIGVPFLRHLGLYAYRVGALRTLCSTPPHPWEKAESLEQLRALALGMGIAVAIVDEPPLHGVDTEADLARAEAALGRSS